MERVFAQTGNVKLSGLVKDESGFPVPGATVVVKGSNAGTITNSDGKFTLEFSQQNGVLVFSFVGLQNEERPFSGTGTFIIVLKSTSVDLDEVVAVGYGSVKKRDVIGSISSVNNEKFKDRSYTNVAQSLAGQVSGMNISQGQGAPGVAPIIRIRGVNSITAGTNPLFVVDGVPLENFNLNMINSQDIESIEVLKDASSSAIYGSRGANGVVLVTTKLGKSGKMNVNATVEYGTQKILRKVDMMDAQQWIKYFVTAQE